MSSRAPNGRPNPKRRADGRPGWHVYVWVKDPLTGNKSRKHVVGRTKAECEENADKKRAQYTLGVANPTVPFGDWMDQFIGYRRTEGEVSTNTISGYETNRKHVSRAEIEHVELGDLAPEHVEKAYRYLADLGRARSTLTNFRSTVSAALTMAQSRGYVTRNVAKLAVLPKVEKKPRQPHAYTSAELDRVAAKADTLHRGIRWHLGLLGIREGECLGLRWDDVDLDAGIIHIRHTLTWKKWEHGCEALYGEHCGKKKSNMCPTRTGGGWELGDPKTEAGKRDLPIDAALVTKLKTHKKRQAADRLASTRTWYSGGGGFVVAAVRSGNPIDRTTDRESWHQLCDAAEVERHRVHDLRHSVATRLAANGMATALLMKWMGWAEESMAARYTHGNEDMMAAAAEKFAEAFGRAF